MYDYLIVGAGVCGVTMAERLASIGKKVLVVEKRNHIGGNCYDSFEDTILVQVYGPHIFHTRNKEVFDYLSRFTKWKDYKHKVVSFYRGKYYPIPINRDTVNIFYGINLKDEKEMKEFLEHKKENIEHIRNSQDVVISKFGTELYDAFVKYYTKKQWDMFPEELDKSILERLPIRYDTNPYYFDDAYQGMPAEGFTNMIKEMLKNKNITVMLDADFFKIKDKIEYDSLIFTGRLDQFFSYKHGKLDYRCIKFDFETKHQEEFLPNSVVNYTDNDVDFTRITEFKKFYGIKSEKTIICKEFTSWEGEPSYPVMNDKNKKLAEKYIEELKTLKKVYFLGRLGSYKYLNIDKAVEESFKLFEDIKKNLQ